MLIFCQRVKDENFLMVIFLFYSLRDPRTAPNQFLFVEGRIAEPVLHWPSDRQVQSA